MQSTVQKAEKAPIVLFLPTTAEGRSYLKEIQASAQSAGIEIQLCECDEGKGLLDDVDGVDDVYALDQDPGARRFARGRRDFSSYSLNWLY